MNVTITTRETYELETGNSAITSENTIDEDNTIGIIIVKKNDKYVMEYCSDDRILTKEYIFV